MGKSVSAFKFLKSSLIGLAVLLCSHCSYRDPDIVLDICLSNQADIDELKTLLQEYSNEHGWTYIDSGDRRSDDLETLARKADVEPFGHVEAMAILDEDVPVLFAENLVGKKFQFVLDIRDDEAPGAQSLVSALRSRWDVKDVPEGVAVTPRNDC